MKGRRYYGVKEGRRSYSPQRGRRARHEPAAQCRGQRRQREGGAQRARGWREEQRWRGRTGLSLQQTGWAHLHGCLVVVAWCSESARVFELGLKKRGERAAYISFRHTGDTDRKERERRTSGVWLNSRRCARLPRTAPRRGECERHRLADPRSASLR